MTKQLMLLRHAKSDWADGTLPDIDRPLNKRGQRTAPMVGAWITENDLIPDLILCSTSVRTRETLALLLDQFYDVPEIKITITEALYLASPNTILQLVAQTDESVPRVLVIAHNPGIEHLASILSGQAIEMPTSACAVFDVTEPNWTIDTALPPRKIVHAYRP